jgi:hypothetical protein
MKSFNLKWGGVIMLSAFMFVSCEKDDALNQDAQKMNSESQLDKDIQILPFFEVAKGDSISKDVYREKPEWAENEAEEAEYSSYNDIALSTLRSYVNSEEGDPDGCKVITDIQARSFKHSGDAPSTYMSCPSYLSTTVEYKKINYDVNKGAGGKYIYLYYASEFRSNTMLSGRFPDVALRDVYALSHKKGGDHTSYVNKKKISEYSFNWNYFKIGTDGNPQEPGYKGTGRQVDLNEGAGGKYIYLFGSTKNKAWNYITEIAVSNNKTLNGYRNAGCDLNDGAGGKYIYLHTRHRHQ